MLAAPIHPACSNAKGKNIGSFEGSSLCCSFGRRSRYSACIVTPFATKHSGIDGSSLMHVVYTGLACSRCRAKNEISTKATGIPDNHSRDSLPVSIRHEAFTSEERQPADRQNHGGPN